MKRLFIAAGAIAATTLAISKVIETAVEHEMRNRDEFDDGVCFDDEMMEETDFINLNKVIEEENEEISDEELMEKVEFNQLFDRIVDGASEKVYQVSEKLKDVSKSLPKVEINIYMPKKKD